MTSSIPDLILPVYLNQRRVFDLVAMLQGGIATVTRVVGSVQDAVKASGEGAGAFGLSGALESLLKINVSGEGALEGGRTKDSRMEEERVHTPASLFQRLRVLMTQRSIIHSDAIDANPQPGDFFEFEASLQANGLASFFDWCAQATSFMGFTLPAGSSKQDRQKAAQQQADLNKQIAMVQELLKAGDTIDVTTDYLKCRSRAVITLERQYLNDPTMSDLVDGTFRVLGKVIRAADEGEGAISLVRKTLLSKIPAGPIQQLLTNVGKESTEISFGTMEYEIEGPVLQLIPIAIFA